MAVDVGERIEELFTKQPHTEFSTTELIKIIYPEEYQHIKAALHDNHSDKEARKVAKRHKGQLHRRLLYHLNRLVEEGTITVTTIKQKGEKHYGLTQHHNGQRKHHPTGNDHPQPLLQLERYQEQGIIIGFDPRGWQNRLNAVLLDLKSDEEPESLQQTINHITRNVNDVIGLHTINALIAGKDLSALTALLHRMDMDTKDNNRTISINIDLTTYEGNTKYLEDFLESYAYLHPPRINLIISINNNTVQKNQRLFKQLITHCAEHTAKIYLHNKDVHNAPIIVGKAGAYTISEEEWHNYEQDIKGQTIGLCLAQTSIAVDLSRYFKEHHASEFREFILKIARSLVESNTLQRREADRSFSEINKLNKEPHAFFRFSNNYIRLWNYDWEEQAQPHLIDLLHTTAEELNEFCHTEETIFKSCGSPIRFKAVMASTFPKFEPKFFSQRIYRKTTINGINSLQEPLFKRHLAAREDLFKIFENNDRFRMFHATPAKADEVLQEIRQLTTMHAIPLLCYDFARRRANQTLDQFMS